VDGHPDAAGRQGEHAGDVLPGVGDGVALEVIAEREVSQHLEEGAVHRSESHLFHVVGAEALLAGGDAGCGGGDEAAEPGHEGLHTRAGEERRLVCGLQGGAVHDTVAFAPEEFEEALAKLATCHTCPILR